MIEPTPGRVVWFYPTTDAVQPGFAYHGNGMPLAAIVAHAWGLRMVNLTVFDSNGTPHSITNVDLVQPEDKTAPGGGRYCTWMPYQIGQAKAHEKAA